MKEEVLCRECGGELRFEESEIYCKNCGLVADDAIIDFGEDFLGSDSEKIAKRRRTGMPITSLNPDFSTTF